MNVSRLDEKAIFQVAREINAAEARRLYLDESCGDNAVLQAQVEALLRVHEHESRFLGSPVPDPPHTLDEPITERLGTKIGLGASLRLDASHYLWLTQPTATAAVTPSGRIGRFGPKPASCHAR